MTSMLEANDWNGLSLLLKPVFEQWHVSRALVFGSWARGEATRHSDVDLLLVQETDKSWFDRYDGILRQISALIRSRDVDLLIYTPQKIKRCADQPFLASALREGKVIYESGKE